MTREYRKTEKALRGEFWATIAPGIPANDKPMLRQAFNDWTDSLERDGRITEYQASRITLGPETPPRARSAARPIRRRMGDDMKPIFLNWKGPQGRETVDSVDPHPEYFPTRRAMVKEARRLEAEYAMCGMAVYQSSRPCANWKEAKQ